MLKRVVLGTAITSLILFIAACAPIQTPTLTLPTRTRVPTLPPLPTATPIPPTPVPTATEVVATVVATSATQPTAMPTIPPTPMLTSTPSIPPGLYVTNMRIDPNPPVRGPDLNFFVTFVNTNVTVYNPRWLVYIYRADTPSRWTSQTTELQSTISPGTYEIKSLGKFTLPLGGPCDYFFAQVAFLDINNKPNWYTTPDGAVFQKGFAVCPP